MEKDPTLSQPTAGQSSYGTVVDIDSRGNPTARSYFDDFQNVRTPTDFAAWMVTLCGAAVTSLILNIVYTVLALFPLYLLILGSLRLHSCPIEPYIPIWMIVLGAFVMFKVVWNWFIKCACRNASHPREAAKSGILDTLINIFLFIWLILGTYWVFHVKPSWVTSVPAFCDKTVYISAEVFIILTWVMAALSLLGMCFFCLCACCRRR